LFEIARRRLAAYYRTGVIRRRALERLRWESPVVVDADEQEEPERMAELEALTPVLAQALGELPQKRRRAVELRIGAGLPSSRSRHGWAALSKPRERASRVACAAWAKRSYHMLKELGDQALQPVT
jgi:hypothetical protein